METHQEGKDPRSEIRRSRASASSRLFHSSKDLEIADRHKAAFVLGGGGAEHCCWGW
jgi:hypothetical protein